MTYQLTESQRKRIEEISIRCARGIEKCYPIKPSVLVNNAITMILTELAPSIIEEGRQAGLEEVKTAINQLITHDGGALWKECVLVAIRALKGSNVA